MSAVQNSSKIRGRSMPRTLTVGLLGCVIGVSMVGCTSYTNVPGPDSPPATQDPNATQASAATAAALEWAARRHGVDGPFALNLPVGTTRETAERIAAAVSPNAVVPDEGVGELPTLHVSRVWIRMSDAKVDVVFPTTDSRGNAVDRGVTVWLHAGVRPWVVSRGQYWAVGTIQTPAMYFPIDEEAIKAAEEAAAAEAAAEAAERAETEPVPDSDPVVEPVVEPEPVIESAPEPEPASAGGSGSTYREVPIDD